MNKNILKNSTLIALGLVSLASCRKNTDWNLNSAPSIELISTKIVKLDKSDSITTTSSDVIVPFDGARVEVQFKLKGGNPLTQLTFHDGTWDGSNMTLITSSLQTVVATPPASRYYISGDKKEEIITIRLKSVTSDKVISMILNDNQGMSNSLGYRIKVKNTELVKSAKVANSIDFTSVGKKSDSVAFVKTDLSSVLDSGVVNSSKFNSDLVNSKIGADSLDKLYPTSYAFVKKGSDFFLTQTDSISKFGVKNNKITKKEFGYTKNDLLTDYKFFFANYYGWYKYMPNNSTALKKDDMFLISTSTGKAYLKITDISGNTISYEVIPYSIKF